jgi:hypothetical protein
MPMWVGRTVFVVCDGKIKGRVIGGFSDDRKKILYEVPDKDGTIGARIADTTFVSFAAASEALHNE